MNSGNFSQTLAQGIVSYLGFLISITFYQAAIAYIAKFKGDNSIITKERASFIPFVHMEILGTFIFPLLTIVTGSPVVFGWPKPFDIDTRNFKKPKSDTNLVYLGGVSAIFLVAIICMIILRFFGQGYMPLTLNSNSLNAQGILQIFVGTIGRICATMGGLFLLPLPGMAGWYLLLNNLRYELRIKIIEQSMIISIVGLFLIMLGFLNFYFKLFLYLFYLGANIIG